MGLETEYGVTCVVDGQRRLSPDEVARYLLGKLLFGEDHLMFSFQTEEDFT